MHPVFSNWAAGLLKVTASDLNTYTWLLHGRVLLDVLSSAYRRLNTRPHKGCPEGNSLVACWVHTGALLNLLLEAAARSLPPG